MLPALVLCAGYGTRLDPLTRLVAKPAVPLAGRALILRVLDWLRAQGVTDVVINLHHRPETIAREVGDGAHLGLRVRYSWEQPLLGSAGGPRHALPLLDAPSFLIVNGDTLCAIDLPALVRAHDATGADVTMAVAPHPAPERYSGVVSDAGSVVTGFAPKGPAAAGTGHFVGVQVVSRSVFEPLPDGVPLDTVAGVYRDRLAGGWTGLRVHQIREPVIDVGTARDYLAAALALAVPPGGTVIESGATVSASARLTRTVVWPGAVIADEARLEDCIVATGAIVPARFRAALSVLVPSDLARPGDAADIHDGLAVFGVNS